MYYVAGGRIYSANYDETSGVYHEVHLVEGTPRVQDTGVSNKPAGRTICTLQELLAQFGRTYPPVTTCGKDVRSKK